MRDKLIYEYSGVDLETVWTMSREELPPVRPHVERAAADLGVRL
jgi:uncharacterized protein with HEPN domain